MSALFSMIQALQMIILIPLLKSIMPANTGIFFNQLTSIATYEIFEIGEYLDEWLSLIPTDPVNEKFETIGIGSLLFINNLGTFAIFLVVNFMTIVLWLVLNLCSNNDWLRKKLTKYDTKIFWNQWINLINESQIIVALCIVIHIRYAFAFNSLG